MKQKSEIGLNSVELSSLRGQSSGKLSRLSQFVVLLGLVLPLLQGVAKGSVVYSWDGSQAAANSGSDPNISVTDLARVNADGALTGTSSPPSPGSGGSYFVAAAKSGSFSSDSSTYFEIILTPANGYIIQLDSISLYSRSTSSGPVTVALYSSIDDYSLPIRSFSVATDSNWSGLLSFDGNSLSGQAGSDVAFRIYGSGGSSASSGNWRIDDVSLAVTLTSVPESDWLGLIVGGALFGVCTLHVWRQRRMRDSAAGH